MIMTMTNSFVHIAIAIALCCNASSQDQLNKGLFMQLAGNQQN